MINYLIKFNEDANEINLYIQCELKDEITQVDIEPYIHFHDNKKFFVFVEGYLLDNLTTKDIIDALVANSRQSKLDGSYNIFIHDYELKNFSLYRDFWGSRTLYMYKKDELNNFSSRISVIRKLYPISFSLNKEKVKEFLAADFKNDDKTFFNEIERIIPNSSVHIKDGSINKIQNKCYKESLPTSKYGSFKKVFMRAVKRRVNIFKNLKIGIMLSGGLDSSAISIGIKSNNLKDVKLLSIDFSHVNNENIDELKFQKNIKQITDYDLKRVKVNKSSPFLAIKDSFDIFDEPVIFPNLYLYKELINAVKKRQIKAIFDGNDGDNVVSHGYEVLYKYFKDFKHITLVKEIKAYSKFHKKNFIRMIYFFYKEFLKIFFNIYKNTNETFLKDNIYKKREYEKYISIFTSHESKLLNPMHFYGFEMRYMLFNSYGIEIVSPFYDKELISYCLNMPDTNKIFKGQTRKVLRDYLSDYLPKDHFNRPHKSILTPGIFKNISDIDIDLVKEELNMVNNNILDVIDIDKLQLVLSKFYNKEDISEKELINLMIIYNLNIFLTKYF